MISRINKKFSSFVLAFYVVGMVILVPLHRDYEAMCGSGHETISTHADAGDCHHIDLSHVETCAICSGIFGRAFVPVTPFVATVEQRAFRLILCSSPFASTFTVLVPFFHRGPPSEIA
jgi:hypothetical protein